VTASPAPAVTADAVRLAAVLVRLTELGPPSEVRAHAARLAAEELTLDRVLLTSIADGALVAEALCAAARRTLRRSSNACAGRPVALDYPLVEAEIMRRRRPEVVERDPDTPAARSAFGDDLAWGRYLAVPILSDGRVVGFFQADRENQAVDQADADGLSAFGVGFGLVFERAVLRQRLRVQRQEVGRVAAWAEVRASELGDRSVSLAEDGQASEQAPMRVDATLGRDALRELLTHRELEVLELMVGGETNGAIARALVVSEGTVKFHVKNILRKMQASNRAEAASRYLRLTLKRAS
jgi:DNA-binding CsgD family transcriptional regulator